MDIIVIKPTATEEDIRRIVKKLESRGLDVNISKGTERTVIGVIGDTSKIAEEEENAIRVMPGVEDVMRILITSSTPGITLIAFSSSSAIFEVSPITPITVLSVPFEIFALRPRPSSFFTIRLSSSSVALGLKTMMSIYSSDCWSQEIGNEKWEVTMLLLISYFLQSFNKSLVLFW